MHVFITIIVSCSCCHCCHRTNQEFKVYSSMEYPLSTQRVSLQEWVSERKRNFQNKFACPWTLSVCEMLIWSFQWHIFPVATVTMGLLIDHPEFSNFAKIYVAMATIFFQNSTGGEFLWPSPFDFPTQSKFSRNFIF